MEWTEIILALLSGTTVASVVEAIRFRVHPSETVNDNGAALGSPFKTETQCRRPTNVQQLRTPPFGFA